MGREQDLLQAVKSGDLTVHPQAAVQAEEQQEQ